MDIAIVGAGMAGLSAGWRVRRSGHRVIMFEANYKPGGRVSSRRKAGLVVDHGERYLQRNSPVLRELILDSGLHSELQCINLPVFKLNEDGGITQTPEEATDPNRVTFPDGIIMLPEALRRQLGGFYSIRVLSVHWDDGKRKFRLETEPPLRQSETLADAVIIAVPASEARRIAAPIANMLNAACLDRLDEVRYDRAISLMAALAEIRLPVPFFGLDASQVNNCILNWVAFESAKCRGRQIEGWSSMVAHLRPPIAEKLWKKDDGEILLEMYQAARRLIPQLPEEWRWARARRWNVCRIADPTSVVDASAYPCTLDEGVYVELAGDYRMGDGAEDAALSGREAADRLVEKIGRGSNF